MVQVVNHLFVVKQNRHNATLQLLKKAVDENRFGRIYSVSVNVFWTRPQEYYDSGAWRGTWALDGGGAVMNQGIHTVDQLIYLAGNVKAVCAFADCLAESRDREHPGRDLQIRDGVFDVDADAVPTHRTSHPRRCRGQ